MAHLVGTHTLDSSLFQDVRHLSVCGVDDVLFFSNLFSHQQKPQKGSNFTFVFVVVLLVVLDDQPPV